MAEMQTPQGLVIGLFNVEEPVKQEEPVEQEKPKRTRKPKEA